jgi:hypothetical protein
MKYSYQYETINKNYIYIDVVAHLDECRHMFYISYRDGVGLPY